MGIKCPNCGGGMVYDIEDKQLHCPYCDTRMGLGEYGYSNAAQTVQDAYLVNLFLCPNCGAELTAPQEQTVAYCAYCGGEATLTQKMAPAQRPTAIIPFTKTKAEAAEAYEQAVKRKLYVPKELKDPAFLEGFRGVYLPYWNIDVTIPEKDLSIKGTKTYTRGGYDYTETYDVKAHIGGAVEGAVYDASAAFDDTLAAQIAPFDQKEARPFAEGYLAGFYADKVTTDPGVYEELALSQATEKVYEGIRKEAGGITLSLPAGKQERLQQVGATAQGQRVSLFPVWFLTYRKGDRVAYSVMNGQTGKLSTEVPVDLKQFFLTSLIGAGVLFLLLSLLPVFMGARLLAAISALLLLVSGQLLNGELKRIRLQEQHTFDWGHQSQAGKKRKLPGSSCLGTTLAVLYYGLMAAVAFFTTGGSQGGVGPVFLFGAVGQLVISILIIRNAAGMANKSAILPGVLGLIIMVAGLLVSAGELAHDGWYYGLCLGCLGGMLLNILSAVRHCNELTTRPVPNFFRREGADNGRN